MFDRSTVALNAICPYFTMFPLDFPLTILERHASKGDWVLDPFCGRGTVSYASKVLGLSSVSVDSSPVAIAITEGKLANSSPNRIACAALGILEEIKEPTDLPKGEFWEWAFHRDALKVICRLREGLLRDCHSDTRRALRAILLGGLHGPRGKLFQSYLSNQSPRTFSPKPRYALKFWKRHRLVPQSVDVMSIINLRAERYYARKTTSPDGLIIRGDSRDPTLYSQLGIEQKVKWVITSPPYFGIRTYLPDQWLRLWFVGGQACVDYSTKGQISHSSSQGFASDLRCVWRNIAVTCAPDAKMIIRMGGINSRKVDAAEIAKESLHGSGWRILTIKSAGSSADGRRQAAHLNFTNRGPLGECDVWVRRDC
jgi:hypothetical protein